MGRFYDEIKNASVERQVEDVYNKGVNLYFPTAKGIEYPFACDGFIDTKTAKGKMLRLIIEYKYDELLKDKLSRAKVLCQVVFYLKRFEENGKILPNVCMVADINECFVIHTNQLLKYLDENVDWNIAPSNAHQCNTELVVKIANDNEINPFVYDVNDSFSFKNVAGQIIDVAENTQRHVHISEHNISNIFDYFNRNVIKNAPKISAHDLVGIFMGAIMDGENYFQHPTKKNILVTPDSRIDINGNSFASFFSFFNRQYTPQEKNRFAAISDRLIQDTQRRNHGDFFTPTLFVDYAHSMIEKALGEDWRDKYVVWDNCCGTKNLTRDYHFGELYSSTLEPSELEISKRYNQEGVAFRFDFLNDDLSMLPQGLLEALRADKPIVFFLNPPYARAGKSEDGNGTMGTSKGTAVTIVNELMKKDKIGACSANLYAQFIYRIILIKKAFNLSNCNIALFCKPNYLSGSTYKIFRNVFYDCFSFYDGVLFNASEFADCSDKWGINFTIWKSGKNNDYYNCNHKLIENKNGEVIIVGKKNIYNLDDAMSASKWIENKCVKNTNIMIPSMTSALKFGKKIFNSSDCVIGYFTNGNNNIYNNAEDVYIMPCPNDRGKTNVPLTSDNFKKSMSVFSARKLVIGNWINDKDEYLAPNENHEKYKEFENDSVVYSIFHSSSNQSSLRQIEYKGKKWNIKNEFFFMGKNEIEELANSCNNDECYNDVHNSRERYVYELLQGITLSEEARAVLNKAKKLVIKSFPYRDLFNDSHDEYQINNWDCGYYQLKALWKEFFAEDYKEFQSLYKALGDKMRPMVYTLGFLR